MRRWKAVRHESGWLFDVGVNADGSLHNPGGYPPDVVRSAVAAAEERQHKRRTAAAQKGARTRRSRKERQVYDTARRIVAGHVFGPSARCVTCGRGLDDPESVERGIGSDCWQLVLEHIQREHSRDLLVEEGGR